MYTDIEAHVIGVDPIWGIHIFVQNLIPIFERECRTRKKQDNNELEKREHSGKLKIEIARSWFFWKFDQYMNDYKSQKIMIFKIVNIGRNAMKTKHRVDNFEAKSGSKF